MTSHVWLAVFTKLCSGPLKRLYYAFLNLLSNNCLAGDSVDGAFLKNLVFEVVKKSEAAGCRVDAVISDMGSGNKALWKCCGISATRAAEPVVCCRHPCAADTDRQLYFLADAPHVLKNIRGHLVKGQTISLPKETVDKYKLPTEKVNTPFCRVLD